MNDLPLLSLQSYLPNVVVYRIQEFGEGQMPAIKFPGSITIGGPAASVPIVFSTSYDPTTKLLTTTIDGVAKTALIAGTSGVIVGAGLTGDGLAATPIALKIDPASTAPVTVGPAGLKVDVAPSKIVVGAGLTGDGLAATPTTIKIDPASTAPVSVGPAGLKVDAPPIVPSQITTFTQDKIGKTITIAVDGTAPMTIDVSNLDDEAYQMEFSAGYLLLKNQAGVVLSTTPIPDLDAQKLTGLAGIAGYTLKLTNSTDVVITAPELGQMFPTATPTATTAVLTKDGKSVLVTGLPVTNVTSWTKAAGMIDTVNGVVSTVAIPTGVIVENVGYDATGKVVYQPTMAAADFWRTSTGALLPDGTTDTTKAISHDGFVKVGPVAGAPKAALHVMASGTTGLTALPGPTSVFTGTASKNYFEATAAPTGERVMMLESYNGDTAFSSVSDTGAAFVKQNILSMDHLTGDLQFGSYPTSRNDTGLPSNILSTTANGTLQSHSVADLRQKMQQEISVAQLANSPGGIIPPTITIGGLPVPIDTYTDYNGGYTGTLTLPIPVHDGQRLLFRHMATFNTTVNVLNSTMAAPLVVTAAMKGVEWVAINGVWHLTTQAPPATVAPLPAASVSATGLLTMGGQTIQLVKLPASVGNFWAFPG